MPKNKKPAGGRPAKNFDPRYGKSSTGSRKPRWSRDDRGERGSGSGPRRDRAEGGYRQNRDERRQDRFGDQGGRTGGRRFEDNGRGPARDDRGGRRFDRDDRGAQGGRDGRRFDRDDSRRDDRGGRGFDRGERRLDGDRGGRRFDRDDRALRRDDRGGRRFENRGSDSGTRRFDRDSRGDRRFEGERGSGRGDRTDGRRFDGDRRDSRRDDRPSRENRPARPQHDGERQWRERREAPQRTAQREQQIDVVHERLTAEAVAADEVEGQSFGDLGLGDNICRVLTDMGAISPFPIQAATIGPILDGKDVLGRGRTGSGKTIAFGAPLVESLLRARDGKSRAFGRSPQALILAPTRELALQIDRTVQPIARSVGLFTTQVYGGVPQARQVGALKKGVDIVIGTPGRIEDLHNQGRLDLSEVRVAVLDEADHMCDLGFLEPVQRILRLTKDDGQKLLFSATLDREVSALVDEFLKDPQVYEVSGEDQDSGTIDHQVLVVDQRSKRDVIEQLAGREGRTIIFSRTRAFADQLVEQLEDADIRAIALHGDLNQAKRTRNIERFSSGRISVLVATDVAARGIHVDDVDLVVQADAPDEYKTYLHRSGRTGRAGREGRVVTLIPRNRRRRMSELLSRAEIDAPFRDAHPGDVLIDEIAGAQLA